MDFKDIVSKMNELKNALNVFLEKLNDILGNVNDFMYTYILIAMLLGVGLYFTIRTRGVQFRLFKEGIKAIMAPTQKDESGEKKVSSFEALMISTASRVGTGNIAGIATAIAAGGPGAVFWMWITALIGGASAFIESTLAQIFKTKEDGQYRGGPSYYMEKALGKRWLGIIFSILLILCFAYGFNGLQSYNMSSTLEYYINDYKNTFWPLIVGVVLAVATGFVIWGGAHRIGFISSVIVPIMATAYIAIGFVNMIVNVDMLPNIFATIMKEAFNIKAMAGGFAGSAVVIGIKRGLFSNEAGMGSAPNASASADVDHPVKQGLVQIISVFIDTILICSSTAMMLLSSGIKGEKDVLDGIPYVQEAISANVGEWGIHFITFSIFAFAFSSLVGNYFYAESNILFIKNNKTVLFVFRITCVIAVFLGALADFDLVWNIADVTMGLMAVVNIVAIFLLSNIAIKVLKNYEEQKKAGKDPVFYEDEVGLTGTVWTKDNKK